MNKRMKRFVEGRLRILDLLVFELPHKGLQGLEKESGPVARVEMYQELQGKPHKWYSTYVDVGPHCSDFCVPVEQPDGAKQLCVLFWRDQGYAF